MVARTFALTLGLALAAGAPATALTVTFVDNPTAQFASTGSFSWLQMTLPGASATPIPVPSTNTLVGPQSLHTGTYAVTLGNNFPSYDANSPLTLDVGSITLTGDLPFSLGRTFSFSATIPAFSMVIDPGPFPSGVYTFAGNTLVAPLMGVPQTIHTTATVTTPIGSFLADIDLLVGQVAVTIANPTVRGGDALLRLPIHVVGTGTSFIEGVDAVSGQVLRFDGVFSRGQVIGFIETVPEPAAAPLLCAAGTLFAALRRRRRAELPMP